MTTTEIPGELGLVPRVRVTTVGPPVLIIAAVGRLVLTTEAEGPQVPITGEPTGPGQGLTHHVVITDYWYGDSKGYLGYYSLSHVIKLCPYISGKDKLHVTPDQKCTFLKIWGEIG